MDLAWQKGPTCFSPVAYLHIFATPNQSNERATQSGRPSSCRRYDLLASLGSPNSREGPVVRVYITSWLI